MLIETVNNSDFHTAFNRMDRTSNFSYAARNVLFEYLDELSEDCGVPMELDVIAICCEYYELDSAELLEQYGHFADSEDEDAVVTALEDHTTVLPVPGGSYVIAQF